MKPLLAVYSESLKLKLISKEEVISTADWIISTEHEPDPYFTRLSHSRNLNELLAALNSITLPDNILLARAVFGRAYFQIDTDKTDVEMALSILRKFVHRKDFTTYEANEIQYIIKEGGFFRNPLRKKLQTELKDRIKAFFGMYKDFRFYHHRKWDEINLKIVKGLSLKN